MDMKYRDLCFVAVVAGMAMAGTSCNDFLDTEPQSTVSPETYFNTADQLGAYVINYYSSYGTNWNADDDSYGGQLPSHGEGSQNYTSMLHDDTGTDNEISGDPGDRFYSGGAFQVPSDGGKWNFGNINSLNFFLRTVEPKVEAGQVTGDRDVIRHYVGEGYFLRALEYFYRLRKLGDFPIVKECLPDDRDVLIEHSRRQPRNVVARFILEDLDSAIVRLTDGEKTGGRNRITRDAAYLLKARVALYEGTFEKYHAGTPFVPDAGAGWPGASKSYNKDFVYDNAAEVEFFLKQALDAAKVVADAHQLAENSFRTKGETNNPPSNPYYDMFTAQDPGTYDEVLLYRKYDYALNVGHSLNGYMWKGANRGFTQEFANTFLMTNGLPIYADGSGYAGDVHVNDTKQNRDWRWQLFMKGTDEYVYKGQERKTNKYPVVYNSAYVFSTSTGYIKGKGLTEDITNNELGHDVTAAVIFRAAEAYLVYLEAACELYGDGLDATAWDYWKQLRTRAGIGVDPQVTIAATDLDKEEQASHDLALYSHGQRLTSKVLYNIRRERRAELMSEGFRMDDLVRWRALYQLKGGKYFLHGCRIFGPMQADFPATALKYDQADDTKNNVSSPSDTEGGLNGNAEYLSLFRVSKSNKFYNEGLSWRTAHYLYPIAEAHFTDTSADGKDKATSPIYQNPGWGTDANTSALE